MIPGERTQLSTKMMNGDPNEIIMGTTEQIFAAQNPSLGRDFLQAFRDMHKVNLPHHIWRLPKRL